MSRSPRFSILLQNIGSIISEATIFQFSRFFSFSLDGGANAALKVARRKQFDLNGLQHDAFGGVGW